ncbi:MAG: hypothetical protein WBA41_32490 [Rivularia sp. (in: cyanobacteria)]
MAQPVTLTSRAALNTRSVRRAGERGRGGKGEGVITTNEDIATEFRSQNLQLDRTIGNYAKLMNF